MSGTSRQGIQQLLKRLLLTHGKVTVESTPRRLSVIVSDVAAKQPDVEEKVRGPPARVRYQPAIRWHDICLCVPANKHAAEGSCTLQLSCMQMLEVTYRPTRLGCACLSCLTWLSPLGWQNVERL